MKNFFDKRERPIKFMKYDLVLLQDKRHEPKGMHHKFDSLSKDPFKIVQVNLNNYFIISYLTGEVLSFFYNDQD